MTTGYVIDKDTPDLMYDGRVPIGGMLLFPGAIYDGVDSNGAPKLKEWLRLGGWVEANGQILDTKLYPDLFAAIGSIYILGDEPQDGFRVPDMRGMFVRGTQNANRIQQQRQQFDDPDAVDGKRLNYSTLAPQAVATTGELVGTMEEQQVIEHKHSIDQLSKAMGGDVPPPNDVFAQAGTSRDTGNFGGDETRPNNIAMYYLIKVARSRWQNG